MTTDDRNRLLADCNSDLWSVRRRACAALGPLAKDDAEVRKALLDRTADEDCDVRRWACAALGPLAKDDAEVRKALLDRTADEDCYVRRLACAALGPLAKDDAEVRAAIQAIVGPLPVVTGLASQVLKRVETDPAALDMATWHHCETTHCLAGWATHLAGARGAELESQFDAAIAGALIWGVSEGYVPDFYADNATALADLRSRVRSCPAT